MGVNNITLESITQKMDGHVSSSPKDYGKFLKNIDKELNALFESTDDRVDLSPEGKEVLVEPLRQEMEDIPKRQNVFLSENTEALSPESQRRIGLSEPDVNATKYTVQIGNHRTAATLAVYNRGELAGDKIIGKTVSADKTERPLTVSELAARYEDSALHSSNSLPNGDPWVNYGKVEAIINDFDLDKFFDPSRDGGVGVVLMEVPDKTGLPLFRDVVNSSNETVKFTNFLYEQTYENLPDSDKNFAKTHAASSPIKANLAQEGALTSAFASGAEGGDAASKSLAADTNIEAPSPTKTNLAQEGALTSAFTSGAEGGDAAPNTVTADADIDAPKTSGFNVRSAGAVQIGSSAYGFVQGSRNFVHSYQDGDGLGMVVSGSDVVISGVDVGLDTASAMGKTLSTSMTGAMAKANIALTVADIGYQVFKEEGDFIDVDKNGDWSVGNKGEVLSAGVVTTGVAIGAAKGMGVALAAAGTTGAAAIVLPLAASVAATVAVSKATEIAIDIHRIEKRIDEQIDNMTESGKFLDVDVPTPVAYKQCFNTIRDFDESMEGALAEALQVENAQDLRDVDFTDPELIREFDEFIEKEIVNQERILEETDGFFASAKNEMRHNNSEVNLGRLKGAQAELVDFKKELNEYQEKQELATNAASSTGTSLSEWHRTEDATMYGAHNPAEGSYGSTVSLYEDSSPLSQQFIAALDVDGTAAKGSLPEIQAALKGANEPDIPLHDVNNIQTYKESFSLA